MEFQDFVLQLDRAPGGDGFITRVLRSPAGEAEAPFVSPLLPAELDELWEASLDAREAERGGESRDVGATASSLSRRRLDRELSLEKMGHRLFEALFCGPVRSCWAGSLAGSAQSLDRGLRLKLQINLDEPLLAPLAELPWEYLFSPEHGGFLGLTRRIPIVRHVRLPLPTGQAPVARPLRLLLVSSQPKSMRGLSLAREGERIAKALSDLPGVYTLPLHNPTIETLRERLLQQEFHVLHFMGHGGFDPESGGGALYLTDANGAPVPVGGGLLASHLSGFPSVRLVFLNACDTARANARAPFAGVATALLRSGMPAVIAMQRPIRDSSALDFSRAVYRRLAAGDSMEPAVTEGRLAITRGHGALLEWGTPVLFLRLDDGRLFAREPAVTTVEPAAPPLIAATAPQRSNRPQRALSLFLLAGALAAGGTMAARWSMGPESQTQVSPVLPFHEERPEPSPTPVEPTPTQERPTQEIRAATPPVKPAPSEHREIRTDTPSPPEPRSRPSSYVVSDGSPVSMPDLGVDVGASFHEREGYRFARFWIAPQGGEMLQQPPVMGPKSIAFPAANGTYHLDILTLDLVEKRATVRVRLGS